MHAHPGTALLVKALITGLLLAFSLTACQSPPSQAGAVDSLPDVLPPQTLFALSVADSCIVSLDAQTQEVLGTLRHPQFNASTDLVTTSNGDIAITIDADAEHDYREILFFNPETNVETARVTVSWAPVKLGISFEDILIVGHAIEKYSNGRFDISIVDGKSKTLLQEFDADGYVTDIAFDKNTAYIALTSVRPDKLSGILVYDTQQLEPITFYDIPSPDTGPPISPAGIALQNSNTLYLNLFQFDSDAPCQQTGRISAMDLQTGSLTPIITLDDIGPIMSTADGYILTGEICTSGQGRLSLIDPQKGEILHQTAIGPGIYDLQPVSSDIVAVSVSENSSVVFFDINRWEEISSVPLPCVWPSMLTARK